MADEYMQLYWYEDELQVLDTSRLLLYFYLHQGESALFYIQQTQRHQMVIPMLPYTCAFSYIVNYWKNANIIVVILF